MRNFGQVVPSGSQKKLRLIKILTRVLTAIPKNKQMKTNSQRLKIQYYKNLWCQWRFWVLRGNLVFQSFHANPHTLPKDRAMLWVYLEREVDQAWSLVQNKLNFLLQRSQIQHLSLKAIIGLACFCFFLFYITLKCTYLFYFVTTFPINRTNSQKYSWWVKGTPF